MKWLIVVLALLLVASVSASGDRTIYYPIGTNTNTTINNTYIGQMNQTPNMTASNLDTSWNLSYYLRDTTRSLTGMAIYRNVNNDVLSIVGGSGIAPYGANLQLYGGGNVAQSGGAIFSVGDAAGTGTKVVWSVLGTTNTPQFSLNNNKIVDLLDPTNAQDAVTLNYLTTHPGAFVNNSYYLRDNSLPLTTEKMKRDVDNDLLSIYGGNSIAGGTGIISLYGKTSANPNDVEIVAGDATGAGNTLITSWRGGAYPVMDMNGNNITGITRIVAGNDAVNKSYVDAVNASLVTGALTSTNPIALSAAQFVVGGPVNVFLRNDLGNQMNTVSTDPLLSTSNYSLSTSAAVKAYVDNKTSTTSSFKIGDTVNYTNFDSNGFQTMAGSARPYRDQTTDAINIKNTATPGISVDPAEATLAYTHTAGLTDYAYTNMQLNHDKDLTATVYPHIHFFAAEGSTMPNFLVQYRWQVLGGTKVTSWTNYKCNMMMFPAPAAGVTNHNLAGNTTGIPVPAGSVASDIIQFRIIRDHSNDSGVFSGNDPYTATVNVISFDAHFLINSLGSSTELFK